MMGRNLIEWRCHPERSRISGGAKDLGHNCFVPREIPRPARKNAGLRDDTRGWQLIPLPILLHPRPYYLLYERIGQRFVWWKLDRALRRAVSRQFLGEMIQHPRARREEAAMIFERRVPHQHPPKLKHRNPVADDLASLLRHHRLNHSPNMLQRARRRFRNPSQILIHSLGNSAFSQVPSTTVILSEVFVRERRTKTQSKGPCVPVSSSCPGKEIDSTSP